VGLYVFKAIDTRDLPVIAATALFAVVVYLVTSLVTDLLLVRIDPSRKATT